MVDFGIATTGLTRMTSTGVIIGSPGWIAPERIRGHDATAAADIWAWGACVAYAATGQSPFAADSHEAIAIRILLSQPDLPALPDNLIPLVTAALASKPDDRPTAEELLDRLPHQQARRDLNPASRHQVRRHPQNQHSEGSDSESAPPDRSSSNDNRTSPRRQRGPERKHARSRRDRTGLLIALALAIAVVSTMGTGRTTDLQVPHRLTRPLRRRLARRHHKPTPQRLARRRRRTRSPRSNQRRHVKPRRNSSISLTPSGL